MFKFDFQVDDINNENPFKDKPVSVERKKNSKDDSCVDWYDSEEITVSKDIIENLDVCKLNSTQRLVNTIHITHMVSGFLLEDIKDHDKSDLDIKKAEDLHSDLIPGVYEGGAKIWECTEDLLSYLAENYTKEKWQSIRVLDLGCGSGMLGIYAYLNGAIVTFQDYNKDVLEKITIPNLLLNISNLSEAEKEDELRDFEKLEESVKFYSGDWGKWSELTKNLESYDIILTSETIYNPQNQQKLLNCLYDKLKPSGKVLLAAKTYYFGVGGSLKQFQELVEKDQRFSYTVVWQSNEGINREIIELIKRH